MLFRVDSFKFLIVGLMIYNNGRLYEGTWENDLKHGK